MVASAYASKDGLIKKLMKFLFRDWMVAVALANGDHFFQIILKPNWRETETSFVNKTTKNIFEIMLSFQR